MNWTRLFSIKSAQLLSFIEQIDNIIILKLKTWRACHELHDVEKKEHFHKTLKNFRQIVTNMKEEIAFSIVVMDMISVLSDRLENGRISFNLHGYNF